MCDVRKRPGLMEKGSIDDAYLIKYNYGYIVARQSRR
jgi:hypothetical protein